MDKPRPPLVKGKNYFSVCKRDDKGYCLPSGKGKTIPTQNTNKQIEKALPTSKEFHNVLEKIWDTLYVGNTDDLEDKISSPDCVLVSKYLRDYLAKKGVSTKMVGGEYGKGNDDHVWLETKDGMIIDGSEGQFDSSLAGKIMIHPKGNSNYQETKTSLISEDIHTEQRSFSKVNPNE